jgi:hypothetical protein
MSFHAIVTTDARPTEWRLRIEVKGGVVLEFIPRQAQSLANEISTCIEYRVRSRRSIGLDDKSDLYIDARNKSIVAFECHHPNDPLHREELPVRDAKELLRELSNFAGSALGSSIRCEGLQAV